MYIRNKFKAYNGLGQAELFNPPAYYQSTDPSQVPVQMYPYGGGMPGPYGPWPGFYYGQRIITAEEAERMAKERKDFMERRAESTDMPEHKYISAEGNLNPAIASVVKAAEAESKKAEGGDIFGGLQKKILTVILFSTILSVLLK